MNENRANQTYEDEINIWELLVILAKRKKIIIVVTLSFFILSIIYSLLATPQYEVSAKLTPKKEGQTKSLNMGSLGSISSLIGGNVGGLFSSGNLQTIQQTLESSDFIFYLDEKYKIMNVLIKEKDEKIKKENLLQTYQNSISINLNEKSKSLTIKLKHEKPVKAYMLMKDLLKGLNEFITKKQYQESKEMVDVLKEKINKTKDPLLKSELTKLWSNETKKMLYSKINKHSLYRVLESPYVPEKRTKPKRKLIVIISTFLGFFISIFLVFFMEFIEKSKEDPENKKYFNKFVDYLELHKVKKFFKRRKK
ncbi:MAG: hypothetical protein FXF47_06645 [Candidatus Mcinerneyibacterium aminivorans]|uniref:Polysaccharide chain length determinant N-terminal domain-containing protein n=1 Tax=Candidatus Mcinerneyibacterium aminivorans TaxID=2703815 RepID=A0A5D0MB39_9BACT|nr:MAG: hypothetical protein FXF47_06645 [Candidatus Mcinerneyibacterium aminivorans]